LKTTLTADVNTAPVVQHELQVSNQLSFQTHFLTNLQHPIPYTTDQIVQQDFVQLQNQQFLATGSNKKLKLSHSSPFNDIDDRPFGI
jgi:hypothetical protein